MRNSYFTPSVAGDKESAWLSWVLSHRRWLPSQCVRGWRLRMGRNRRINANPALSTTGFMKIRSAEFLVSAPDVESCPAPDMWEFAFIGRSNVGKSSLINMLTRKAALAKVSGTPGKTSLINFYTINGHWRLVDLPGYGYAKLSKKAREHFHSMIRSYLAQRTSLRGIFVLLDAMLPPQKADVAFIEWLVQAGLPFMLVFTKTDRISAARAESHSQAWLHALREISADTPPTILSSARTGAGRDDILSSIAAAIEETPAA